MKPTCRQAFTVTIELPEWVETTDVVEASRLVGPLFNAAIRLRRGFAILMPAGRTPEVRILVAPAVENILYWVNKRSMVAAATNPSAARFQGLGELCLHDGPAREVTFIIETDQIRSNVLLDMIAKALQPLEGIR